MCSTVSGKESLNFSFVRQVGLDGDGVWTRSSFGVGNVGLILGSIRRVWLGLWALYEPAKKEVA